MMGIWGFCASTLQHLLHETSQLFNMSKRTKNAMVVGKFDTLSGASLQRQIENIEVSQHSLYLFKFCGKYGVKREAFGNLGMQRLWER